MAEVGSPAKSCAGAIDTLPANVDGAGIDVVCQPSAPAQWSPAGHRQALLDQDVDTITAHTIAGPVQRIVVESIVAAGRELMDRADGKRRAQAIAAGP